MLFYFWCSVFLQTHRLFKLRMNWPKCLLDYRVNVHHNFYNTWKHACNSSRQFTAIQRQKDLQPKHWHGVLFHPEHFSPHDVMCGGSPSRKHLLKVNEEHALNTQQQNRPEVLALRLKWMDVVQWKSSNLTWTSCISNHSPLPMIPHLMRLKN